jgi:CO/xanthine dehydrogenase Mo-binding subunit
MPGPYYIPNVWVDARCVYTNRTPSSAMRGFGVTGADFALEVQMDKLARLVGMDPMEFRILNAYRDGDMKAHRRVTKNAALIECVQAAAQLADWPLSDRFRAMSSMHDGGGERGAITSTPTPAQGPGAGNDSPRRTAPLAGPEVAVATVRSSTTPDAPSGTPRAPAPSARSPMAGRGRMSSLLGTRRR